MYKLTTNWTFVIMAYVVFAFVIIIGIKKIFIKDNKEINAIFSLDETGFLNPEQVKNAIRPDTTLISVMFANNEIGTIEPITQIGRIAREAGVLFHTDAVQAYAQLPISVQQYPVDLLSASAHNFTDRKALVSFISGKALQYRLLSMAGRRKRESVPARKIFLES